MATTGAESISTKDLKVHVRDARDQLRNLTGAAIDHRCCICLGNSSTGCTDANELDEEQYCKSLKLVNDSATWVHDRVRGYDRLQEKASNLQDELLEVNKRIAKVDLDLLKLQADYQVFKVKNDAT